MPTNVLVLNKSWLVTGAGSPEGVQTGPVGSLYMREDGASGATLYVKESGSGNTGWVPFALIPGPQGPQGLQGAPGVSGGKIFYYAVTDASDIAGYKTMLEIPSAQAEQTVGVSCSGTADVLVSSFATDPGVPGATEYLASTAYRRFFARTSAGSARLHLMIYVRNAAGQETLIRDEFSDAFTNTTVAQIGWLASASIGGTLLASDRIVNKVYAQRVSGAAPITVTVHFEGTTHASQLETTIVVPLVPHHASHETGGADAINGKLTARDEMLLIHTGSPSCVWHSENGGVNLKKFVASLRSATGELEIRAFSDDGLSVLASPLILARNGNIRVGAGVQERTRSVSMGEWIDVANNQADFTGAAAPTVTTFVHRAYTLIGKTCTYSFRFTATPTVSGGWFSMALPSGIVSTKAMGSTYFCGQSGRASFMYVDAGGGGIVFTYDNFGNSFPMSALDFAGVFTFQMN